MKKRFTEAQIIGFLREAEAGLPVKDLCRRHGFSEASYYLWRSKFGGMSVSDAKRLKELETENGQVGTRSPASSLVCSPQTPSSPSASAPVVPCLRPTLARVPQGAMRVSQVWVANC